SSTTNETDKLALLAFKATIKDPYSVLDSWNDTIGFCHWYGLRCGLRHQRVTVLNLSSLGFSGSISPYIGNLSFLSEIYLPNNGLVGEIPPQIGRLRYLRVLQLDNNLLAGEIPRNMSSWAKLEFVSIDSNQLTGEIPPELGSLSKLGYLSFYKNALFGNVPSSFGNLSSLYGLHLRSNNLGGSIPKVLGCLTNLQVITFGDNRLSSTIPSSLLNLSSLVWFDVASNRMLGSFPVDLGLMLPNIQGFSVGLNQFEGPIPSSISNWTNLEYIELGSNKLSGKVPSFRNMPRLWHFSISHNELGSGNSEDLSFVCSLTNYTRLKSFIIGRNRLGGALPKCIGNFSSTLKSFKAYENLMFGKIPREIGNLVNLEVLCMAVNKFSGEIPPNIGNLQNLAILSLGRNNLRGTIPTSLGNLTKLIGLILGQNNFHGQIPSPLSKCQSLQWLDLSSNNLSSTIPPQLIGLSSITIFLNLSCNRLSGVLPLEVGNLRTLTELDIFDNMLKKVKEPISTSMEDSWPYISYRALLKATGGFSSMNLIGVGSFGSVYKGIIEENGTAVAVKVLHLVHRGALKSFMAECEALKNTRHRNLLKILTICSGIDYRQNDFKALVYEYMEKGSLERWLHPNPTPSHRNQPIQKLNFFHRINVAIDVAFALDYLHHRCHIPIVHCDLKPGNILLDADMVAHVGDFGLAKFLLGSSNDTIANQMSSFGIRGTIGYAPPEYAMGCEVSREGDIYSYGILLLEMFTGLSPTDDIFRDNLTLHSFVAEALPERAMEITDHILLQERENHLSTNSHWHWLSK
ncbi:hypothetical protein EUGRSUZ_E03143, partial [Eucalyptus grandis]